MQRREGLVVRNDVFGIYSGRNKGDNYFEGKPWEAFL